MKSERSKDGVLVSNEKMSKPGEGTITPLLRSRDVAKLLGISEAMVLVLSRTGKLPSVRFHAWPGKTGTVRFTQEAVREFIEKHTKGGGR